MDTAGTAYGLGIIILGYVLGSIPTGYWMGKIAKGIDIRQIGSGSTGATNVLRAVGKKEALIVLMADISKGYLPVLLAMYLEQSDILVWNFAYPHMVAVLTAISALVGHSKSMFLGFTGGKSAATGLGTLLAFDPLGGTITLATWLLVLYLWKIVSLASIVAAFACPIAMYWVKAPNAIIGYGLIAFAYVTLRHKSNIGRLLIGTEPNLAASKKTDSKENSN
ncbi:MAG: glycerol-3-phosphate 1-O-acyltransferase PlsY [Candidatus Obscuribacterales bacterium]|nr:glycerol-3-phosphate 1-O-acyltransferase PlsY [Candidatus Obscuribacterales bacterium]